MISSLSLFLPVFDWNKMLQNIFLFWTDDDDDDDGEVDFCYTLKSFKKKEIREN